MRGFKVVKGWEDENINLPVRATKNSAGYDFECGGDTILESYPQKLIQLLMGSIRNWVKDNRNFSDKNLDQLKEDTRNIRPTLVPTGVKAYMQDDEGLFIYNRSSNPLKRLLILTNGVGVIDSDYYSNPGNDGHIMFQFINIAPFPIMIEKGEKIGQGIFKQYLKADEVISTTERTGGMGSTD